jgi:hypothetical protein
MKTFVLSVGILVGSASVGLQALESGDAGGAVIRFALAALAAIWVGRTFVRGVFADLPPTASLP